MKVTLLTSLLVFSQTCYAAAPKTFFEYQLLSPKGEPISLEQASNNISDHRVILVGEWHSHSAVHRFQSDLYKALLEKNPKTDLSMEQFSRPAQSTLDQYLSNEIGERALIAHGRAWPNYTSDYRALIEQAKVAQRRVIAANAPRDIVHCIGQVGPSYIKQLSRKDKKFVAAKLDTSDRPYKAQFMTLMQGLEGKMVENMYAAQVSWDETMAESIANHLKQNPDVHVMHTAGKFHVENGDGIAYSLKKRAPETNIALITPVTEIGDTSNSPFVEYQLLVLPLPKQSVGTSGHGGGDYSHPHVNGHSGCEIASKKER
ncbi:iron-regulated protein [Vibrio ishigakensis]|uniref:Iron-regulated protein n=1 Tax=Vibrio ishigakensis TaxID=1481914 RepID=A0A0B8Q4P4_9VIBR|nr:iron-regulated protein [Vibrio ishigakensis]